MVQTTEKDVLQKSSPRSLLAFSLCIVLPTCYDSTCSRPIRLIACVDCSSGEAARTRCSESCQKKVVQTTERDVSLECSPNSPLAFSLSVGTPAGRARSLCRPVRLPVVADCGSGEAARTRCSEPCRPVLDLVPRVRTLCRCHSSTVTVGTAVRAAYPGP